MKHDVSLSKQNKVSLPNIKGSQMGYVKENPDSKYIAFEITDTAKESKYHITVMLKNFLTPYFIQ